MKRLLIVLLFSLACVQLQAQSNWRQLLKDVTQEKNSVNTKSDTLTVIIHSENVLEERQKHLNYQLDSIYLLIERVRIERSLRVNYNQSNK